ncbi:MAG: hypothetical protein QME52_08325 [Bacteroidota bacterium]|nr:hypothetical protein [Bacteroidota bacterium]
MKPLRIFFVDKINSHSEALKNKLSNVESVKFLVSMAGIKNAGPTFAESGNRFDVILFGEKVAASIVIRLTKIFRSHNIVIPIFILTKQSEARVARKYRTIGIDDMLNIADIDTPLFSWSFMSAIEQAMLKKKASEYDVLHRRLKRINSTLSSLVHDINNPLSVIRLAMYHLDNPKLSIEKKETFMKMLINNIERLDNQMKELRIIRRQLNGDSTTEPKVLAFKPNIDAMIAK